MCLGEMSRGSGRGWRGSKGLPENCWDRMVIKKKVKCILAESLKRRIDGRKGERRKRKEEMKEDEMRRKKRREAAESWSLCVVPSKEEVTTRGRRSFYLDCTSREKDRSQIVKR